MTRTTSYFVLPFFHDSDGDLLQLEVEAAPDVATAKHRAFNLVGTTRGTDKIVGAIAFSQAGDLTTRIVEDALIIERYGETPQNIDGME
jgi:hypothetical protein